MLNQLPFEQQSGWFVKGPLGLGVKLIPNNLNILFIGGTGILVFMDFLSRLALYNCGVKMDDK